jgi:hypothetical protein
MRFLILVASTVLAQADPSYKFYVSIKGLEEAEAHIVPSIKSNPTFVWSWDTCAGVLDHDLEEVKNPILKDGVCLDSNGKETFPADAANIFPGGFDSVVLEHGFNGETTTVQISGGPTSMEYTLDISGLKSDYYVFKIAATDSLNNVVKGQSVMFSVDNGGTLPPLNQLILHSPLKGSCWVPGTKYRIRYQLTHGVAPDGYLIDLLTPQGDVIMRIDEGSRPKSGDDLLKERQNILLNYTLWDIPVELEYSQVKIRVTGVQLSNDGRTVYIPSKPAVVDSGIFFLGPRKASN